MSELRKDPIVNRWVIIAAERAKRPGSLVTKPDEVESADSKSCPLCEGNEKRTPAEVFAVRNGRSKADSSGWTVRVVPNKYPALIRGGKLKKSTDGILKTTSGIGAHEIIIETPDHTTQLADMPEEKFFEVMKTYRARMIELKKDPNIQYILIFKNKGLRGGASLSHAHSQLIALPIIPKLVDEEIEGTNAYYKKNKSCAFCELITQETKKGVRVIDDNGVFVALSPFASRYPFEICILPKKHMSHFEDSSENLLKKLTPLFQNTLKKLNKALGNPPYNFILHTAPAKNSADKYHWHIEIIPITTHIAGFERGTDCYINTVSPEAATMELRKVKI